MHDYDLMCKQLSEDPYSPDLRHALADLVSELTGYPADEILESGDATGMACAMHAVLHQHRSGARLRQAIREAVPRGPWLRVPISVCWGHGPPTATGEAGRTTFKNGGECRYPGSARAAGYRTTYHRSTLRIEVGHLWLLGACARLTAR